MKKTPWTKTTQSLPSRSSNSPSRSNKGKSKANDPPKSKALLNLETLADVVQMSTGKEKDPKRGCFCQARDHALSAYIPICYGCGLVLCELNLPQFLCPHCDSQLLTSSARACLLSQLKEQILTRLVKEEQDREREIEDVRRAAGEFPDLKADSVAPVAKLPSPNQTHKVLSLNHGSKKVTVSSYIISPAPSRPLSRGENIEEQPVRIPKPQSEGTFGAKLDYTRPWADQKSRDRARYIPKPSRPIQSGSNEGGSSQWKKTRRNKKPKEVVDGGDSMKDGMGAKGLQ